MTTPPWTPDMPAEQVFRVHNPYDPKVISDDRFDEILATAYRRSQVAVASAKRDAEYGHDSMGFLHYIENPGDALTPPFMELASWGYYGGERGYSCVLNATAKLRALLAHATNSLDFQRPPETGDFLYLGTGRVNEQQLAGSGLTFAQDGVESLNLAGFLNQGITQAFHEAGLPLAPPPGQKWQGGEPLATDFNIYSQGRALL